MQISRLTIALLIACGLVLASDADEAPNHSVYEIPVEFDPEPGTLDPWRGLVRVEAPELSVMITGEHLAANIRGVQGHMFGYPQDTMMIVKVLDHPAWDKRKHPSAAEIWHETIRDLWEQTGTYQQACFGPEMKDELTGFYRYYTICDPEPNLNGNFYLMDRLPDPTAPPPTNPDFLHGTCRLQLNPEIPEVGRYHRCRFTRETPWGDRFTFRLHGPNVGYLDQVETHLQGLLAEWRTRDEE